MGDFLLDGKEKKGTGKTAWVYDYGAYICINYDLEFGILILVFQFIVIAYHDMHLHSQENTYTQTI